MEYRDIILKYITNEATAEERKALEDWLKEDVNNAQLFEEAKQSWEAIGKLNSEEVNFDTSKAWNSIQEKIKKESKIIPINSKKNYTNWVAGIAALLVLTLFSTWFFINRNNNSLEIVVQSFSERKLITLPDSSKVWLNNNSKLIYHKQFDLNKRIVKLEGEAFFDVIKNPNQPFVIENKDFEVKVLGTSFNVLAYAKLKEVLLTVVSGTVAFKSNIGETVLLTQNEIGSLNKSNGKLNESLNSNQNFIAWKTNKIEFNNDQIKTVCDALKDYFLVDIIVEDKTIYNCKFTGSFDNPKLQDVLKIMENTLNIKIKTTQNRVTISGKGC